MTRGFVKAGRSFDRSCPLDYQRRISSASGKDPRRVGGDSAIGPSGWLALAGVCLGVFMFTLDGSIVNIAVPTLIRELDTSIGMVQWVIQAYLCAVVLLLLPFARIARRVGQKRLFLFGIAVFSTGSLLCGIASTVEALIASRILQAIGATAVASLMSSIAAAVFPPNRLAQALGIVTATATLGTSLGPTIGGFLISLGDWHSIFLVNLPIGFVAFLLVVFSLPKTVPETGPGISLREYASIFRVPPVRNGLGAKLVSMMANGAFLFLTPLLLENALKFSTAKAGVLLAASPILVGVTSPIFGALADRFGRRAFLVAGQAGMVAGMLVMHTFSPSMTEWGFLLRVAVWGVSMGVFNAPNSAAIMGGTSRRLSDAVSAMLSLSIILGQLLGVAAGGALFRVVAFGGDGGARKVIDLSSDALADAIARSLPVFALPLAFFVVLTVIASRSGSRR